MSVRGKRRGGGGGGISIGDIVMGRGEGLGRERRCRVRWGEGSQQWKEQREMTKEWKTPLRTRILGEKSEAVLLEKNDMVIDHIAVAMATDTTGDMAAEIEVVRAAMAIEGGPAIITTATMPESRSWSLALDPWVENCHLNRQVKGHATKVHHNRQVKARAHKAHHANAADG